MLTFKFVQLLMTGIITQHQMMFQMSNQLSHLLLFVLNNNNIYFISLYCMTFNPHYLMAFHLSILIDFNIFSG